MPLPNFDANGVLPPTTGNPTDPNNLSPYPSVPLEIGQRFGSTLERRRILTSWLDLRGLMRQAGFNAAFQWVDGSFLEDIEQTQQRPPRDVDVITFYWPPTPDFNTGVVADYPELVDHDEIKARFSVDHYFVDLSAHPIRTVDMTAYWCGLFSHRRDGVWKGLLRIELGPQVDDDALRNWLTQQP